MPDRTPFSKVSPGQPTGRPLAAEHNAFVDAAQWVKAHQQGLTHGTGSDARCSGIVRVKNVTGAALDRFAAVALRAPIILPTANPDAFSQEPLFTGETPSMPDDAGRTAVLLEPATASGAGQIVRAVVSGATVALIDIGDPSHQFAALKNGACALASAAAGDARILWKAGDSGQQLALVILGASSSGPRLFVLTSEWDYQVTYPEAPPVDCAPSATAYTLVLDEAGCTYVEDQSTEYTLWHPHAYTDDEGKYIGLPFGRVGQRLWAAQSNGRFEVCGPDVQTSYHVSLDEGLESQQTGHSVPATVLRDQAETDIKVKAYLVMAAALPAHTKCIVTYFEDEGRFGITAGECLPES